MTTGVVDYVGLQAVIGIPDGSPLCKYQGKLKFWPQNRERYDVAALRKAYDGFASMIAAVPAFAKSFGVLEGHSNQAVLAIDEKTTAYPHRKQGLTL